MYLKVPLTEGGSSRWEGAGRESRQDCDDPGVLCPLCGTGSGLAGERGVFLQQTKKVAGG